jgi:hypothetical protein
MKTRTKKTWNAPKIKSELQIKQTLSISMVGSDGATMGNTGS